MVYLVSFLSIGFLGVYAFFKKQYDKYVQISKVASVITISTVLLMMLAKFVFGKIFGFEFCNSLGCEIILLSYSILMSFFCFISFIIEPLLTKTKRVEKDEAKSDNVRDASVEWRLNRINRGFLSSLGHEIRSPLNLLINISDSMDEKWVSLDEPERKELISIMKNGIKGLSDLVLNASDLTDLISDDVEVQYVRCTMKELLDKTIASRKLHEHFESIDIVYNGNIEFKQIECDHRLIMKALGHLIINVAKHAYNQQKSKILISIFPEKIEVHEANKHKALDGISVQISDNGIGIPKGEFFRIFQPFHQSSRTIKTIGGKGLGLPICFEIIKLHGGKIWVENNRNGTGATFTFIIPISKIN